MFFEIAALKVSQYSEQNTCAGVCFNKVAGLQLSCEYYKIFKNGLFHKTPPMSTSEELEGGRTQGWVKMLATMVGHRRKIKKRTLAKTT